MPISRSIDIDHKIDYEFAKMIYNKKVNFMTINFKRCYIIAEIGVNHNGSMLLAKKLIDKAKASGADAVKFQTFKAERLSKKNTPKVAYQKRSEVKMRHILKC